MFGTSRKRWHIREVVGTGHKQAQNVKCRAMFPAWRTSKWIKCEQEATALRIRGQNCTWMMHTALDDASCQVLGEVLTKKSSKLCMSSLCFKSASGTWKLVESLPRSLNHRIIEYPGLDWIHKDHSRSCTGQPQNQTVYLRMLLKQIAAVTTSLGSLFQCSATLWE